MRRLLVMLALIFSAAPSLSFAWGHEGHEVVALIAELHMTSPTLAKAKDLLGGASIDSVASGADDYRHDHPETGPWHYIEGRGEIGLSVGHGPEMTDPFASDD